MDQRKIKKERSFSQTSDVKDHFQAMVRKDRNTSRGQQQIYQSSISPSASGSGKGNNAEHYESDAFGVGYDVHRQRSFMKCNPSFKGREQPQQHQQQQQQQQQRRRSAMPASNRSKPAMEIYRPPTLRAPGIFEHTNGDVILNGKMTNGHCNSFFTSTSYDAPMRKPGLNVNAKEFIAKDFANMSSLNHSKSSSNVPIQNHLGGVHYLKSGANHQRENGVHFKVMGGDLYPRVHFSDDKENDPELKAGMQPRPLTLIPGALGNPIKRSKSLGPADLRHVLDATTPTSLPDLGPFSPDVQAIVTKAATDPSALNARQLMDVIRHLFTRLVEASRLAEPAARLCIAIIEKETGETVLETLLNTCQEYFQERDRRLRNNPPVSYPGFFPSHPKWIAYMTFLSEMYTQLKRRYVQLMTKRMRNSETAPGLLLLTLLSQCCHICLREPSVNSLQETECLFFVLTGVGKDIEVELPHQMARIMGAARDAFLTTASVPAVRKTLLQLIELHAARWQLSAPAVMYYYPGSETK